MNIFFDVDSTLICDAGHLRPLVHELFGKLKTDGDTIYVWSGLGLRWEVVHAHNLAVYVSGVFVKPTKNYAQFILDSLEKKEVPVPPDLIVDDIPDICSALGGIAIKPYFFENHKDREMDDVYRIISEFRVAGHSEDPRYRRPLPLVRTNAPMT